MSGVDSECADFDIAVVGHWSLQEPEKRAPTSTKQALSRVLLLMLKILHSSISRVRIMEILHNPGPLSALTCRVAGKSPAVFWSCRILLSTVRPLSQRSGNYQPKDPELVWTHASPEGPRPQGFQNHKIPRKEASLAEAKEGGCLTRSCGIDQNDDAGQEVLVLHANGCEGYGFHGWGFVSG